MYEEKWALHTCKTANTHQRKSMFFLINIDFRLNVIESVGRGWLCRSVKHKFDL